MLVKIIISLKRIWHDPAKWWGQAHWFSKLTLVLFFSLTIGSLSIGVYSASIYSSQKLLLDMQSEKINELATLKSELLELKNDKKSRDGDVLGELADLRSELLEYQAQQQGRDQILGLSNLNTSVDKAISVLEGELPEETDVSSGTGGAENLGMVRVKDNWTEVDVYKEAKASSALIGVAEGDKIYFYDLQESGWYRIDLEDDGGQKGWIHSQFLKILN